MGHLRAVLLGFFAAGFFAAGFFAAGFFAAGFFAAGFSAASAFGSSASFLAAGLRVSIFTSLTSSFVSDERWPRRLR